MKFAMRRPIALGLSVAVILFLVALLGAADPNAIKHQGPDTLGNPLGVALNPAGAAGTFQTALTASANGAATATNASLTAASGITPSITSVALTSGGASPT